MSSYVYNQSHNKQSDINQVTIGAMGDHCFGRGGAGGFRVFSLSLRGACRISHLVVPKQQNGSPNQQMVVPKQQNGSPNQQMMTPFQQNGYPRKYKMGCANYMHFVFLFLSVKSHILDCNGVWYSSFWSEGPKSYHFLVIMSFISKLLGQVSRG